MQSSQYASWTFINITVKEKWYIWNVYIIYVETETMGSIKVFEQIKTKMLNS